jgi:hypothetical protein
MEVVEIIRVFKRGDSPSFLFPLPLPKEGDTGGEVTLHPKKLTMTIYLT